MTIDDFCKKLDARLATRPPEARVEACALALSQAFKVKPDEVAIFMLDPGQEVLRFAWPVGLKKSGLIPLSSRDSLVALTARDKKTVLNNNFSTAQHAYIFEHIRTGPSKDAGPLPIQKILSVPLCDPQGQVKGAIQVSRKGTNPDSAGPDFTKSELAGLAEIAKTIARNL